MTEARSLREWIANWHREVGAISTSSEVCQKKVTATTRTGDVVYSPCPEGNLGIGPSDVHEALLSGIVITSHASDWCDSG
jgi:hypothetical protein